MNVTYQRPPRPTSGVISPGTGRDASPRRPLICPALRTPQGGENPVPERPPCTRNPPLPPPANSIAEVVLAAVTAGLAAWNAHLHRTGKSIQNGNSKPLPPSTPVVPSGWDGLQTSEKILSFLGKSALIADAIAEGKCWHPRRGQDCIRSNAATTEESPL